VTNIIYILYRENFYSTTVKTLNTSNIIALDGTYPNDGIHTDGYWYIKKGIANQTPTISITSPSQNEKLRASNKQRIDDITKFLDSRNGISQYDNELVRRLIQSVKIVSKEKIIVQFKSGKVVEKNIL